MLGEINIVNYLYILKYKYILIYTIKIKAFTFNANIVYVGMWTAFSTLPDYPDPIYSNFTRSDNFMLSSWE